MEIAILTAVAVYAIVVLAVGLYSGRNVQTGDDYYVAGRRMGFLPTALSMWGTILSGGMILGTVGLFYLNGAKMLGYGFAYMLTFPIFYWIVGRRMMKLGQERGYYTIAQFLSDRYQSRLFRIPAGVVQLFFLIPYMAVNAVAMGVILDRYTSLPYFAGAALFIVMTYIYVLFGGLKSVIYTDVVQGFIGISFFIIVAIAAIAIAGNPVSVLSTGHQAEVFPIGDLPATLVFWSWIVFLGFSPLTLPDRALRFYSIRNSRELSKSVIAATVILMIAIVCLLFMGGAFRVLVPGIAQTDQVIVEAVVQYMTVLVPFFVVAVWAAGMSTMDSQTIACATVFESDIMKPLKEKGIIKSYNPVLAGRLAVAVLLIFSLWFVGAQPPFLWSLIDMALSAFLQFLPAMIGGLFLKRLNKFGAEAGFVAGILIVVFFTFITKPPLGIHAGTIALIVNAAIYLVSYFASAKAYDEPVPTELANKANA